MNIELKENIGTWSNKQKTLAIKEIIKNRENNYNTIYESKQNDNLDIIKKCILFSSENNSNLEINKVEIYSKSYLLDTRYKIKIKEVINIISNRKNKSNYRLYIFEYKKSYYLYNTKDLNKIKAEQ